jgi:hypothetical protein
VDTNLFYLKKKLFVVKVAIIPGRCKKSGNHLWEDLAKSGYKPNVKYKSLIILLYFGYTLKTKYTNLAIFTTFFFPHFK